MNNSYENYEKLAQELGLNTDELSERIEEEGERIFTLGWDAERPGGAGANFITEWQGRYFFSSTDMEPEGPFETLDEALALEYFTTDGTPNPEIYSDDLPFERLEQIARQIDAQREETFVINDKLYEWDGDSLKSKK